MPRTTDRPLTAQEFRFVASYVRHRDLEKAAQVCKLTVAEGKKLYNRPAVRADIDRRLNDVRLEQAKLAAIESQLTNSFLDEELRKVCQIDAETHGPLKLSAIRLGLVATGRIKDGNCEAVNRPAVAAENTPVLYQQIRQQTEQMQVTRTVTESQETLASPSPRPPQPALTTETPIVRVY